MRQLKFCDFPHFLIQPSTEAEFLWQYSYISICFHSSWYDQVQELSSCEFPLFLMRPCKYWNWIYVSLVQPSAGTVSVNFRCSSQVLLELSFCDFHNVPRCKQTLNKQTCMSFHCSSCNQILSFCECPIYCSHCTGAEFCFCRSSSHQAWEMGLLCSCWCKQTLSLCKFPFFLLSMRMHAFMRFMDQ